MPRSFIARSLLVLFLIPAAGEATVTVREGLDSPAQQRLAGEWRLVPRLTERLTGSSQGGPEQVTISATPSVTGELPGPVMAALQERPVDLAGTLTFGRQKFLFLLTEKNGSQRLLCYSASGSVLLWLHFAVVPASQSANDLLFLGGETATSPFFAYERAYSSTLSADTKVLLQQATDLGGKTDEALSELAESMEWQGIIEVLVEEIRRDPQGQHNNRLIALGRVLGRHLKDVRLDLDPLIPLLASQTWTNQQKTAEVLAIASGRPDLLAGREKALVRALIPLTTSQRGPVVQPALTALRALTGQTQLARNPVGWVEWFKETYGEEISLTGAVYETLGIIRARSAGEGGAPLYSLNGSSFVPVADFVDNARGFVEDARRLGVQASFVSIVPFEMNSASTRNEAFQQIVPVQEALARLGISNLTVAPASNDFYPLFEGGLPHSDKSTSPGGGG